VLERTIQSVAQNPLAPESDLVADNLSEPNIDELAPQVTDLDDTGSQAATSPPTPPLCSEVEMAPHALLLALPELETLERYERRAFFRRR
jgi:hypothetical protein